MVKADATAQSEFGMSRSRIAQQPRGERLHHVFELGGPESGEVIVSHVTSLACNYDVRHSKHTNRSRLLRLPVVNMCPK
ncbi:hypothetical protein FRACA_90057 [Frankia canadensis]|uniref:Uncharacterized protein n=1 Tax=Frankia canadensis TaxID=1836972 RepID=A0A2I2L2B1_9ACTN|nr:hypothetical protein FRACA_90057 [Frankia canadensis]SOU59344.1 hypothetical protein FRACA_90057 [Frankia canadensis]